MKNGSLADVDSTAREHHFASTEIVTFSTAGSHVVSVQTANLTSAAISFLPAAAEVDDTTKESCVSESTLPLTFAASTVTPSGAVRVTLCGYSLLM